MSASKMTDLYETLIEHTNAPFPIRNANETELLDQTTPATKRAFSRRASITRAVHEKQYENSITERCLAPALPLDGKLPSQISRGGHSMNNLELEEDVQFQSGKRQRNSNWPLKSQSGRDDVPYQIRPPLRGRRNIPMVGGPSQFRPSKFVEGSMNDKTSQMPHPSFIIGSEDVREQFDIDQNTLRGEAGQKQLGTLALQENQSATLGSECNKSEASRPSSIVRFGKSLASAFNPSSWRVWSRSPEEGSIQEPNVRDRRERAEKAYNELRQNGQLRNGALESYSHGQSGYAHRNKHDFGIGVDHRASTYSSKGLVDSNSVETPLDEKRYGRIFLDPPSITALEPAKSLASGTVTMPKKSSVQFSKPSPPERCMNDDCEKQFSSVDDITYGSEDSRSLPSRKDLLKQQKLVKRVSDLEGKLEAARRQLAEALGEPVPKPISTVSRSSFVPDSLSSLSSERLLSMDVAKKYEIYQTGSYKEIGQAISIGERPSIQIADVTISTVNVQKGDKALPKDLDPLSANVALDKPIKPRKSSDSQELELTKNENILFERDKEDHHLDTSNNTNSKKQPSGKRKNIDSYMSGDDDIRKMPQVFDADTISGGAKFPAPHRKLRHSRKLQKVGLEPFSNEGLSENKRPSTMDEDRIKGARIRLNRKLQTSEHRYPVLQKKPNPPAKNNRISRGRREHSQLSSSLSAAVAEFPGEGLLNAKPSREYLDQLTVKAVAANDVPPVPQLPKSIKSAVDELVTDVDTRNCAGVSPRIVRHGRDLQHRKSIVRSTRDVDEEKVETKKPFEWPADVF